MQVFERGRKTRITFSFMNSTGIIGEFKKIYLTMRKEVVFTPASKFAHSKVKHNVHVVKAFFDCLFETRQVCF